MKKRSISVCILLLTISCQVLADLEYFAQSYMATRPIMHNIMMEQAVWHNFIHNKHGEQLLAAQMIGVYQTSLERLDTAQYFLPVAKKHILVAGDNDTDRTARDVRAEWLRLPSDFRGNFMITPKQKQIGVVLQISKDLDAISNLSFFKNYWINITFPFVVVTNDLNFKQTDLLNAPTDRPHNLFEAFNQCDMKYARFKNHDSKFSVPEINIKFGRAFMAQDHFQVVYYSLFRLPTDPQQSGRYLFEPVAGNNGHLGFGAGVNFQIVLNRDTTAGALSFFTNLESTFFIRNTEYRSFDLKGKPWSRYMLLNKKDTPLCSNIPAVNVLTRQVTVRPFNTVEFAAGWRYNTQGYEVELGYSLWGHGDEKIEFKCPLEPIWGIAGSGPGLTASGSTISTQAADDANFVPICDSNLNLCSGAARAALVHKIFASFGAEYHGYDTESFFGIGGSYENPQKNSSLQLWNLWVKVGVSF